MAAKAIAMALTALFLLGQATEAQAQLVIRSVGQATNPRAGQSASVQAGTQRTSTVSPWKGYSTAPGPKDGERAIRAPSSGRASAEQAEEPEETRRYQRKRYRPYRRKFGHQRRAGQPVVILDRYSPGLPPPETVVVLPPTDPEEPEAESPEAEALPPPPITSPRTVTLARGTPVAPPVFVIGERLPRRLPHVTLDWRTFGLPQPPQGQIYARVKSDVLLIDAATRRVIGMIDPTVQQGEAN